MRYKGKSIDELKYIIKDAGEAAVSMRSIGAEQAEFKYLDQMNDACTELHRRRQLKQAKR